MSLGKRMWKNSGAGLQIYLLLSIWFLGIILGSSVSHLLLGDAAYETASNIRISNSIGSIFLFLLPATVYAALFADAKGDFLIKHPIAIKTFLLAILAIFCIQPFVETVNHYNELITLPESLASVQDFFDKSKESSQKTIELLIADKSTGSLLINLLVIAVLPGIVEELFFRGCLQRSILKTAKNTHVAVWITAIIFSLLHFQLSGLIPRIFLGALLGYLYAWTKNIWVPIVVHIINNASVIIILQKLIETDLYKKIHITDYSLSNSGYLAAISLVVTTITLFFVYKYRVKEDIEEESIEDQ